MAGAADLAARPRGRAPNAVGDVLDRQRRKLSAPGWFFRAALVLVGELQGPLVALLLGVGELRERHLAGVDVACPGE